VSPPESLVNSRPAMLVVAGEIDTATVGQFEEAVHTQSGEPIVILPGHRDQYLDRDLI
jgi:anti-anti-sigma regulatory factor